MFRVGVTFWLWRRFGCTVADAWRWSADFNDTDGHAREAVETFRAFMECK